MMSPLPRPRLRSSLRARSGWLSLASVVSLALLLGSLLAACGPIGGTNDHTLTLVTIFPASGADTVIGLSMQRAVDLAVKQNASLSGGYSLTVTHVDEASVTVGSDTAQAVANPAVIGAVGPFSSQAALETLPALAQAGVVTISPTAMLPGLTQATEAASEGLTFSQLHPQGKPNTFFRMTADDNVTGAAAAALAVATTQAHGLGANAIFIVNDDSLTGVAQASAFQKALKAAHGTVAGNATITLGDDISVQTAVSAIIEADPDAVYFAGDSTMAAQLRRTLTLTGAPQMRILLAGAAANDPGWSDAVGGADLSGYTTGLLPAQDLSKLQGAQSFISAYQAAYSGATITPQSAQAYDAAMDEISAIKSLLAAQKAPTRAALLGAVAGASYTGVTGQIAFDSHGDPVKSPGFSIYTCDTKGQWSYQGSVAGA